MESKTISLSEEAYERLLELKKDSESFSELIIRLTRNASLRDLVGVLPEDACEELEDNIELARKKRGKIFEKSLESLKGQ